jgi:PPM family protein phosphatase
MLEVEFAQLSDVGRVRGHNEDYFGHTTPASPEQARTEGWLFVLADGVGGHDRGEVASQAAVESVLAGFHKAGKTEAHSALLERLVREANTQVYEAARTATPGGSAMATTIVACALRYDRAVVAHVGDSRCYLVRRAQATALTRDHTLVGEQVRLGLLSPEEAAHAETRHLLSRSLGNNLFVNVDIAEHQLLPGDVLVLSSDGLHSPVPAAELAGIVSRDSDLHRAAHELIARANEKDGSDNVTVQLIRIRDVERIGMYRGRPYKLR